VPLRRASFPFPDNFRTSFERLTPSDPLASGTNPHSSPVVYTDPSCTASILSTCSRLSDLSHRFLDPPFQFSLTTASGHSSNQDPPRLFPPPTPRVAPLLHHCIRCFPPPTSFPQTPSVPTAAPPAPEPMSSLQPVPRVFMPPVVETFLRAWDRMIFLPFQQQQFKRPSISCLIPVFNLFSFLLLVLLL